MRRLLLILASLALATMTGCSSLGVKVEVLDASYAHRVVSEGSLQLLYFDLQRYGAAEASRPVREAATRVSAAGMKLAGSYEALAVAMPKEADGLNASADALRRSVSASGSVGARAAQASAKLDAAGDMALKEAVATQWRYDQAIPPSLRVALESVLDVRAQYGRDTKTEIQQMERQARLVEQKLKAAGAAEPTAAADAKAAGQELATVANVNLKSLIGGGSLANSEYAYVVAKAPPNYWAPSFNSASSGGYFGNSDFVIKMNSLGDFTIKGMRFDASTVAKVASKVTTQALLLGAQIAGVPVATTKGSVASGDGARLADASSQLATDDATVAMRKASFEVWRQAVREMASAVLAEDGTLKSIAPTWDKDKGKVISPIATSFNALSPVLKLEEVK